MSKLSVNEQREKALDDLETMVNSLHNIPVPQSAMDVLEKLTEKYEDLSDSQNDNTQETYAAEWESVKELLDAVNADLEEHSEDFTVENADPFYMKSLTFLPDQSQIERILKSVDKRQELFKSVVLQYIYSFENRGIVTAPTMNLDDLPKVPSYTSVYIDTREEVEEFIDQMEQVIENSENSNLPNALESVSNAEENKQKAENLLDNLDGLTDRIDLLENIENL